MSEFKLPKPKDELTEKDLKELVCDAVKDSPVTEVWVECFRYLTDPYDMVNGRSICVLSTSKVPKQVLDKLCNIFLGDNIYSRNALYSNPYDGNTTNDVILNVFRKDICGVDVCIWRNGKWCF